MVCGYVKVNKVHLYLIKMFTKIFILINERQNNERINTQDTRNSDVQIYGWV